MADGSQAIHLLDQLRRQRVRDASVTTAPPTATGRSRRTPSVRSPVQPTSIPNGSPSSGPGSPDRPTGYLSLAAATASTVRRAFSAITSYSSFATASSVTIALPTPTAAAPASIYAPAFEGRLRRSAPAGSAGAGHRGPRRVPVRQSRPGTPSRSRRRPRRREWPLSE